MTITDDYDSVPSAPPLADDDDVPVVTASRVMAKSSQFVPTASAVATAVPSSSAPRNATVPAGMTAKTVTTTYSDGRQVTTTEYLQPGAKPQRAKGKRSTIIRLGEGQKRKPNTNRANTAITTHLTPLTLAGEGNKMTLDDVPVVTASMAASSPVVPTASVVATAVSNSSAPPRNAAVPAGTMGKTVTTTYSDGRQVTTTEYLQPGASSSMGARPFALAAPSPAASQYHPPRPDRQHRQPHPPQRHNIIHLGLIWAPDLRALRAPIVRQRSRRERIITAVIAQLSV
eukprot:CAMPEP_0202029404 /NCGR_PEP_ID=MMETSP0905-20130828/63956_1 /ASSEMBLY_ACC=CAM_ASM_000554 /TAXON_ID=420261 /ORGANISM="Thalassiosira antarctica, Strain CCMP982" /LENGTH=285 /DNA_ID=CAMNT_0048593159 /DNA_START=193 /DNA_END=1051 /DNA_ORIENTATION=+